MSILFKSGAVFLSFLLGAPSLSFAEGSWPEKAYNPAGEADMILLPIPCGGKIALRKITTISESSDPAANPLGDQRIVVGRTVERTRGYMEDSHQAYIAGTLSEPGNNNRYYLMGAYEITVGQYNAVMKGPDQCADTPDSVQNRMPITEVSWYDAVDFTRKLNKWIYSSSSNMLGTLSQIGADNGYIRLPTEVEWEFAARGGDTVTPTQRNEPVFFTEGTLDDYAWYNGAMSSGGKPKPVGGKKPNPLGLYDMYGNAGEIVLEPFRMTRSDRLHGAIGGFVVRGGSFLDTPETLTSARRDELPFFDARVQGENKLRTMGFRVVVGTSSLPRDVSAISGLEAAFEEIRRQVPGSNQQQPLQQMQQMASQIQNTELRTKIEQLSAQLQSVFVRRNDLEARNIRISLKNGALQARELELTANTVRSFKSALQGILAEMQQGSAAVQQNNEDKAYYTDRIKSNFQEFSMLFDNYMDTITTLADNDLQSLKNQAKLVQNEYLQRRDTAMASYVDKLIRSIDFYKQRKGKRQILHFLPELPTAQ